MKPDETLPHLQQPATWPYSESHKSSPCPLTSWRSILIISSHLRPGFQSGLFPSGSPPPKKNLCEPLLSPYVLRAKPIPFFSIWLA